MRFQELDTVVLQRELPEHGLRAGDMGTVVFPGADFKFFLTADLKERARRRLREQGVAAPDDEQVAREAEKIAERDRTDSEREISPLRRPESAIDVDTTALDFERQVEEIVRRVTAR